MMLKHMLNIFPAIPLQISQGMNFPPALNEVKSHFQFIQNGCRSWPETIVITGDEEQEKETQ